MNMVRAVVIGIGAVIVLGVAACASDAPDADQPAIDTDVEAPADEALSEAERRRIFRLLVEYQDGADARAETEFPEQDPLAPGFDRDQYLADTQRQLDRSNELSERCAPDIQAAEEISEDEMFQIRREGVLNGWPPL